jgi:PAS domain S-box-containing protein
MISDNDKILITNSEVCAKKHTENEMRKLSSAVEQVADIVFITDIKGNIEYTNPAFERITGYSRDEVIGKNPSIMKSGDMNNEYYNKVWDTILSGRPIHAEVKNRRKDGSIFYYNQTITPLKNEDGILTHFVSTGHDITEKRIAEDALRESEERYNLAIAGTNAGIWDWINIAEDKEWWSPRFYEMLGYKNGEIESSLNKFSELLHPEDRERTYELVNSHFNNNTPFNIEYRLKTKSGEYKWFLGNGLVKRDADGKPLRMVGSITDIDAKKKAEELLRESELRFRAIFDQTFQLIGLLKPDGTLIETNKTALDFGGFTAEDVRGKKFWDTPWWSLSEDSAANLKNAVELAASGKFVRYETEIVSGDGRIIIIDFSIKPIRDENGDIVLLIPEGRDITEKRSIEDALRTSEEQMRLFIKHTPAAVAMFDKEMKYLAASARWYNDYNIDGRDIIGKSHYEIFPEIIDMEEWKNIHQRCLNGESISNDKDIFPRSDGRIDWIRWDIHPWMTNDGRVGGIIMFTEVITERIENELRINKEREKAQRYLDIAGNIFVVINKDQNVELINQKGCEITGYPEDEIIGKNWFDLVLPEDKRERVKDIFNELMNNELELGKNSENLILTRGGELRTIAWNNTIIRDENGEITSTLSSGIDITEKKLAEEKLLKLNEDLEERVNIRTLELRDALDALSQNEQRAMLLKDVASAANAASTVEEAFQISLEKICNYTGWPVGHVYLFSNKTGRLFSSAIWHMKDHSVYSAIRSITDISEFEPGIGLPGRIYISKKPEFIEDIYQDENFIRTKMGIDPGVNKAFGFPVIVKDKVEAVLEFFTDRIDNSNNDFLIILNQIGTQLGYVIERKRVEIALRKSETKFRTIFNENIHFLLGFVSTDGILLEVNNAALELIGVSADEVINKPFWEGPWWKDSPVDRARLRTGIKTASEGKSVSFEATHLDSKGEIHYIDFSLTPVKSEKGEVEYLIPSGFDITERKKVLREREVLINEMEKRVKELNCLYRISDSIQNNRNIDDVFEYAITIIPLSWQYPEETSVRITYNDKEYCSADFKPSEWKLSSEITIDGAERGTVEIFYSSEKPSEDEGPFLIEERNLIDGITHLFSLMIKRQIIQEDLNRAKLDAESANNAKSEFLANMSHEIRTPMNAIMGMNYLLKKTELNPRQKDYLYKIDMSSQILLGIINDILDLSKIESGKIELEHTTFSLNDIIINLSNMIGFKAQEKGLELIISIDDTIPAELKGDPLRLGQILLNLANNAVKFTEAGEIVIEAVTQKISGNKAVIKFSITDTGIGMHAHEKEKLFHPFIQADASTTRKYGGTGLGLAICKRFVEMMNGTIGIESEYGKGSVFYFTVELEISKLKNKNTTLPENLKSKKVLVADDNRTSCRVLSSYLEKFSFTATSVYSGEEVLSELERTGFSGEEPYSFIFLDWEMPGMNGIETAKKIIESFNKDTMPRIIMVTGYEQEEIFRMASDIGLDGFIIKPVTSSTLLDVITNTLSHDNLKNDPMQHTEKKPAGIFSISGGSILVVEDNEINREVAREILENEGLKVDMASNGLEAYNKLAAGGYKNYDIVLMDLQMPVMGGFETAMLIREKISSSELPIVAMTADVASDIKEKVIKHGMNGYISKPINTIELFRSLLEFIKPDRSDRKEKLSIGLKVTDKIPIVRGLDTAKGLSIIGGNIKLYRKLLFNFADSYRNGDQELMGILSKNEMLQVIEFLHTLKGVSGNLGFTTLPALSDLIVRNLNDGKKERIDSSIEEIAVSLKNSVEDILSSHYMKDTAVSHDKETTEKLSSNLKKLITFLDTDHSEAIILIETILDLFPDSDYINNLDRIAALLNVFDIDRARELINTTIEQLEQEG